MAPVTWAHGGAGRGHMPRAGAPGTCPLPIALGPGACTPPGEGPSPCAFAGPVPGLPEVAHPMCPVEAAGTHPRAGSSHPSSKRLGGPAPRYNNIKILRKQGTGRSGWAGIGHPEADDSGSWHHEYQVHLHLQPGRAGAQQCWCHRDAMPPPLHPLLLGHCSLGQLAIWAPQPCPAPQAPVRTLPCAHVWPWAAALEGEGCSGLPARQGSLVAHALGTGIMICALLGGGGGGVLGGTRCFAGPRGLQSPSSEK